MLKLSRPIFLSCLPYGLFQDSGTDSKHHFQLGLAVARHLYNFSNNITQTNSSSQMSFKCLKSHFCCPCKGLNFLAAYQKNGDPTACFASAFRAQVSGSPLTVNRGDFKPSWSRSFSSQLPTTPFNLPSKGIAGVHPQRPVPTP